MPSNTSAKDVRFGACATKDFVHAAEKLQHTLGVTLGPAGHYVAINSATQNQPIICNDGAIVAAHVNSSCAQENLGLDVFRQAAMALNNAAGDGTTTATLLAACMLKAGMRHVEAGCNPVELRRGMQAAADAVCAALKTASKPAKTEDVLHSVALTSCKSEQIARLLAKAFFELGSSAVVSVEKASVLGFALDFKRGMLFDRGMISPKMADNNTFMQANLHQPYILITNEKLSDNFLDIVPVLDEVIKTAHPLLIIADDVRGMSLSSLLKNKQAKRLQVVAVKAPQAGNLRLPELEDIAAFTGGEVVCKEKGVPLSLVRKPMLGRAQRVQVTKERTIIIGGKGKQQAISARVNAINAQALKPNSPYDTDVLRERAAKLQGKIATLSVGCQTESELNEVRSRIQDAMCAVRSAMNEGILPGGGVALLNAENACDKVATKTPDEARGAEVVKQSLKQPFLTLCENAGLNAKAELEHVRSKEPGFGIDFKTGKYCNMLHAGVVDVVSGLLGGVQTAASVAGLALVCEYTITNKQD